MDSHDVREINAQCEAEEMARPYGKETHTQNVIAVYVTHKEKEDIRKAAGEKGMSKYLLDLHLSDKRPQDSGDCPCTDDLKEGQCNQCQEIKEANPLNH